MSASMIKALILDGQEQLFKSPEKAVENEAQFAAADNDGKVEMISPSVIFDGSYDSHETIENKIKRSKTVKEPFQEISELE